MSQYQNSGGYFEPRKRQPVPADPLQRGVFYLGLLTMFRAFPLIAPPQFSRALLTLDIAETHAGRPQAKGWVDLAKVAQRSHRDW